MTSQIPIGPLRFGRRTLLKGGCGALALAATPRAWARALAHPGEPLDFVALGRELLSRHGLDPDVTGVDVFYDVMRRACATIPIGPITLYVPKLGFQIKDVRGKSYPSATESLRVAVPALLRTLAQVGKWSGATVGPGLQEKGLAAFAKELEITKDFDAALVERPLALTALFPKPDDKRVVATLDALKELQALTALAPTAGLDKPMPIPILVLPTRREMVEFLCMGGLLDPGVTSTFHSPEITGWNHSFYGSVGYQGRVQILCMEEGHTGEGTAEMWAEASQGTEPELASHTLTYDAMVSLLGGQAAVVPNWFALGMGFQGVFEQYGRVAARLGADSIGDVTPPRQAFVPGGQSEGGKFPPNLSALRGTLGLKELKNFLAERKQAAYKILDKRDGQDPQRKAANADDEVVYMNFRDADGSEANGYLHFGPYLGQDVTALGQKNVPYDLALIQRALFACAAAELSAWENGTALPKFMTVLPGSTTPFEEIFENTLGITPSTIERTVFAGIKKK
jgi:hypothetical protein